MTGDARPTSVVLGFTQSIYKQMLLKDGNSIVVNSDSHLTVQPNLRAEFFEK